MFDPSARSEYLTGFHKRKLERKKKAQKFHQEQERLAKVQERKERREEDENNFKEQWSQLQQARAMTIGGLDNDEEDGFGGNQEWEGFTEEDPLPSKKGILARKTVYTATDPSLLGDALVDEITTVEVEELNTPQEESRLEAVAQANCVDLSKLEEILEKSIDRAQNYAVVCGVTKPKQKKKKFRYLTKAERRENNRKVKLGKLKNRKRALDK